MEEKQFHLITEEERVIQFKMNYHNEITIFLIGKNNSNIHILNTERSSFPKESNILQSGNDIINFLQKIKEKENQYDVILLSEKVLKSNIDYMIDKMNGLSFYKTLAFASDDEKGKVYEEASALGDRSTLATDKLDDNDTVFLVRVPLRKKVTKTVYYGTARNKRVVRVYDNATVGELKRAICKQRKNINGSCKFNERSCWYECRNYN